MERNFEHDCHDDSNGGGSGGSANFWIKDYGLTEIKPGPLPELIARSPEEGRDACLPSLLFR